MREDLELALSELDMLPPIAEKLASQGVKSATFSLRYGAGLGNSQPALKEG